MPKKNLAASKRSCNIGLPVRPISTPPCSPCCGKPSTTLSLQQSRCNIYDGTRQTKSTYGKERLTSNFTRTTENGRMFVQSSHARKAYTFPSGCWPCMHGYTHYSIAPQPADYNDYLISKLCAYYYLLIP